ncbi:AAA family ATPase [Rhodococcoides fascians]|uniref:AAA family ATPase n=1 Tax=Rhodococcoides fascians TaxID=1828 RepID=UPI0012D35751|nr:hypothetical protein [Rhodococcus fascians]
MLLHLTFIGNDVRDATVEFGETVTVVRGPSDTGKSFVVDAIDFMLGASSLKEIPQRTGYSTVLLGVRLPSAQIVTLSRSVNGGSFGLYDGDVRSGPLPPAPRTLSDKHSSTNEENLSRYLLQQIDLEGKQVRKNIRNEKKSLSFRNIASLCVVDETKMQSETSPTLSGRPTDKTAEISTLKLLLQGEDDSSLVTVQSKTERNRLTNAKTEVLDELIAGLEAGLTGVSDQIELRAQLSRLNETARQQNASIADLTDRRREVVRRQEQIDRLAGETRARANDIDALVSRFRLLSAKYTSDLDRLDMVGEAGTLLGLFSPGTCLFCGAEPEHQHLNGHVAQDSTHFGESVASEQSKTAALQHDLYQAIADLDEERAALLKRISGLTASTAESRRELRRLGELISPQKDEVAELLSRRSQVERHLSDYDQIAKLNAMKIQIATEGKAETAAAAAGLDLSTLSAFSRTIAERLQAWGVPGADQVRYDRSEQDLVADDQLRAAHGKGVRAILHSAFTIALAQFCLDRDLPHPGFVVLDSPLVTYRPPDPTEEADPDGVLDPSVAGRFYADIQASFKGQIIIMENMDPPDGLEETSRDIPFTKKTGVGRYGFFHSA